MGKEKRRCIILGLFLWGGHLVRPEITRVVRPEITRDGRDTHPTKPLKSSWIYATPEIILPCPPCPPDPQPLAPLPISQSPKVNISLS
ncbi:MAG: hypothetical protein VKL59_09920 [Nostocaceae cyanobacterium]|nr:hypothetical protein [Nostocaceae cyanobacterium]